MICNCGASCRSSETKEGEVFTCPACGRREVRKIYVHETYPGDPGVTTPRMTAHLKESCMPVGQTGELFK